MSPVDLARPSAAALKVCRLCRRPLDAAGDGTGFCCTGCARVFDVLSHLDPGDADVYLRAARALGIVPDETATTAAPPESPPDPSAEREERFLVDGLSCPSCAWVVERVLASGSGVRTARVDFFTGAATVRYDLRRSSPDDLAAHLKPLGYCLRRASLGEAGDPSQGFTLSFLICAVITMNVMTLSAIRYAHQLGWISSVPPVLPLVELGLCIPVIGLGLGPIARRALRTIAHRAVTMDVLITVSAGAAFLLSCAALALERRDVYFETAAGLVTISLLGRMIEERLRRRSMEETATLMHLDAARVRTPDPGGREHYRQVGEVQPGERVMLHPGELVPFDGEVSAGEVQVSEAMLTGEPAPLRRVRGDAVLAGSRLVEGVLELSVSRPYGESRLQQIAAALRRSLVESEGRLRSADAVASWFTPLVLGIAAAAWLVRLLHGGWDHALSAPGWFPSVSVLAVACPCAFSLAGATAITTASASLLRVGLLVKSPAQLEELRRAQTVIFDKTGTLTDGQLTVERLAWRDHERPELLPLVLAAESRAQHPAARALRLFLSERGVASQSRDEPASVEDRPGQGRILRLKDRELRVGAASLFKDPFLPDAAGPQHTLVWFGADGQAEGCFLLADALRKDARATVAALQAAGLRVEILSGDRQEVCDRIAEEVGAEACRGAVTLEEKVSLIKARVEGGEHLIYVGDGTNDALAMAAASASVAIAGSTDEALTAAGLVMLHSDLSALPTLLRTGRRLWRVIRGNYLWAFAFNGLFVPIAALGYLTPLAAVVLMGVSSSGVLLRSLGLRR